MKTSASILFAVLGAISLQNQALRAQSTAPSGPFLSDTSVVFQLQYTADTAVNLGLPLDGTQPEKFFLGVRSEFGTASTPKFQTDLGFDIGFGEWVLQGDYRSYGGQGRPTSSLEGGLLWVSSGGPTSSPIAPFPTSLDGIDEYSLTAGRIIRIFNNSVVVTPSIGVAAVSRNYVHYSNCYQITQPGYFLFLFIPIPSSETYYQYNATVESEVSVTVPLSIHMVWKIASWIGLSLSGWTEIGNGGTSGWSAGLEIGALP